MSAVKTAAVKTAGAPTNTTKHNILTNLDPKFYEHLPMLLYVFNRLHLIPQFTLHNMNTNIIRHATKYKGNNSNTMKYN